MTVEAQVADTAKAAEKSLKDAEKSIRGLVERLESGLQEVLEVARERSKVYADGAGEQLETAQKYVAERVQERPLAATAAALGVGLLIGVLLASSNRR
jgi:ElaB/YqjD/DUF883 family membrane-anchored ribosome-binding protein